MLDAWSPLQVGWESGNSATSTTSASKNFLDQSLCLDWKGILNRSVPGHSSRPAQALTNSHPQISSARKLTGTFSTAYADLVKTLRAI